MPSDPHGCVLQGHLDLGQCGDRNIERDERVENAILAQISMRQHVITDLLALPQSAAMAYHQPAVRTQHRQVVGDVFGVGGPHANVDEGHAFAARAD